jgi:hypothetical protein
VVAAPLRANPTEFWAPGTLTAELLLALAFVPLCSAAKPWASVWGAHAQRCPDEPSHGTTHSWRLSCPGAPILNISDKTRCHIGKSQS